jgi:hypothetical protein
LGATFSTVSLLLILTKNRLGCAFGDFFTTHLVTLVAVDLKLTEKLSTKSDAGSPDNWRQALRQ